MGLTGISDTGQAHLLHAGTERITALWCTPTETTELIGCERLMEARLCKTQGILRLPRAGFWRRGISASCPGDGETTACEHRTARRSLLMMVTQKASGWDPSILPWVGMVVCLGWRVVLLLFRDWVRMVSLGRSLGDSSTTCDCCRSSLRSGILCGRMGWDSLLRRRGFLFPAEDVHGLVNEQIGWQNTQKGGE